MGEIKKQKIRIERELSSSSENIIWNLISTTSGLSKWLADEVTQDGNRLRFTWGETWGHHETKEATILESVKNDHFRFRWDEEEDEGTYIDLRMEKNDLTNVYILYITDFADPGDTEGLKDLWNGELEQLHRVTGV